MIVKNESHIIENTLKHLLKYIKFDYWVICDTGSTDNTIEIIEKFFEKENINGKIYQTPWKDFGFNRTDAFEKAYNLTDYVFVWDADDSINGNFVLPNKLTGDWYRFIFGNLSGFRYTRCQIFNNRKKWKYVGVLHEYPASIETVDPPIDIEGDYYFISGRSGARNKDPNKYLRDAEILEKAFEEAVESKDPIQNRYCFYCAQSYNSHGNKLKAIEWYKKVLEIDNWYQEKYVSCLEIYDLYESMNQLNNGLAYLVESYKYDKHRIECFYRLIKHYVIKGIPEVANMYYGQIKNYFENIFGKESQGDKLFVKRDEYIFYLPYYLIILGDRTKNIKLIAKMYEMIFKYKFLEVSSWWIHNLFHNIQFCINELPLVDSFIDNMFDYINKLRYRGIKLNDSHNRTITKIVERFSPVFCDQSNPRPKLNPILEPILEPIIEPILEPDLKPVEILFSITTCKRFDLFKKTMFSILNNWKDIDKVNYFLCVDDNSSEDERDQMKKLFPFFNYIMKGPEDRGHRESMNIIWNKLNDLKPKFWIHLEDDWMFFQKKNYITKGIELLNKYENMGINQIVFNKNYGLMYSDLERVGGIELERDLVLHEKKDGIVGRNVGYWPHYSLQPSIVRTKVILELGNYDSPNKFFERDYANKYFANNYKTGYFPLIYSLHIGKQHWETEGKNAYALNEIGQFNNNQKQIEDKQPEIKQPEIKKAFKNLLYMCVFCDTEYIKMTELLLTSIKIYSKLDNIDLLIFTSNEFKELIENISTNLNLSIKISILNINSVHEAACSRLFIFDYLDINNYSKILYLDTDIIVQNNLNTIFNLEIEDKLYGIGDEGQIKDEALGGTLFNFEETDKTTIGINSGVLLFKNLPIIKSLFNDINLQIKSFRDNNKQLPICYDQPFINYHAIKNNKYNINLLNDYICLTGSKLKPILPDQNSKIIINHFFDNLEINKYSRMKNHINDLLKLIESNNNLFSNRRILYKEYEWVAGRVSFENNFEINTTWGKGKYVLINEYVLKVSWSKYEHILIFNNDFTKYYSFRFGDFNVINGILIKNKSIGTMMDHLLLIIDKIKTKRSFGLIRPSDGEYKILSGETITNCDKWTFKNGGILQKQLEEAVSTKNPNLYIGIPCNTCNIGWNCTEKIYSDYINKFKVPIEQRTYANIFGNSNWKTFIDFIRSYEEKMYLVTSGTEIFKESVELFKIDKYLVNNWDNVWKDETDRILKFIENKRNQLILFSAGPISKVWIPMCMKKNPYNMYVDVGASIDILTKGESNRSYINDKHLFSNLRCLFKPEIPIVLHTFDKYSKYWNYWYYFIRKYVTGNNKIYFLTEEIAPEFVNEVVHIKTGKGEWGKRLINGLSRIKEEYIFYMQEDFWPSKPFDINKYNDTYFKHNMDALRICHDSYLYSLSYIEENLYKFNKNSNYLMTHQFSLWNKSFFLKYIHIDDSPWHNELHQSQIISKIYHKIYLIKEPWYEAVVRKGKLEENGINIIKDHKDEIEAGYVGNLKLNFINLLEETLTNSNLNSNSKKNLIYMCVFHQEKYIELLKLLIKSISIKGQINLETTDILIITSLNFRPLIEKQLLDCKLPVSYYILNLSTLMESSCCKLNIFDYEKINDYENILYLDTDVLINSDVNILFNAEISNNKLYALEEGNIGHDYWGGEFFDLAKKNYDKNTPGFSAGVFYFKNSSEIKSLFTDVRKHIQTHIYDNKNKISDCLDQPFLVYNSFIQNKYNNQIMKMYLENNPVNPSKDKIIYHFPGIPGHYTSKINKMNDFWNKINLNMIGRKILVLMNDNRELEDNFEKADYWSYAAYINKQYCDKFGYDFKYINPYYKENTKDINTCIDMNTKEMRHASWSKIIVIQSLINKYDYVVYVDSDCCFLDFNKSVDSIINKYEDNNKIIFSSNYPWNSHLPCAGFFIIKNTIENIKFLDTWYRYPVPENNSDEWKKTLELAMKRCGYSWSPGKHWEQDVLWTLIANNKTSVNIMEDEISLVDSDNQYIRHICSVNDSERYNYFKNISKKIIERTNITYQNGIHSIKNEKIDTSLIYKI